MNEGSIPRRPGSSSGISRVVQRALIGKAGRGQTRASASPRLKTGAALADVVGRGGTIEPVEGEDRLQMPGVKRLRFEERRRRLLEPEPRAVLAQERRGMPRRPRRASPGASTARSAGCLRLAGASRRRGRPAGAASWRTGPAGAGRPAAGWGTWSSRRADVPRSCRPRRWSPSRSPSGRRGRRARACGTVRRRAAGW